MIKPEIQNAVRTLFLQKQHSLREITRALKLSRNTVRRILRTLDSAGEVPRPTAERTGLEPATPGVTGRLMDSQ
jgi:DNA-binding IclR family transcriptional regulator